MLDNLYTLDQHQRVPLTATDNYNMGI